MLNTRWTNIFRAGLVCLCLLSVSPLWAAGEKLPIWRVGGGQAEFVILGSIHFSFPEIYPLRPEIETAFAEADTLVVELDVNGPNAQELQYQILQRGLLEDGQTLSGQLSEPVWRSLENYMRSRGLPVEGFMNFHPALAIMTLSTMRLLEMGMRPELGIDQHFLDMARDSKTIVELETAQQQVDLLMSFPDSDLLVEQTLVQLDQIDLYMRPIYNTWKSGDADQLNKLLLEDELAREPRFRPVYKALFDDRNLAMTNAVEGFLQGSGSYFVVVGAGHLVGEKGIIALLKQRGFNPQPL